MGDDYWEDEPEEPTIRLEVSWGGDGLQGEYTIGLSSGGIDGDRREFGGETVVVFGYEGMDEMDPTSAGLARRPALATQQHRDVRNHAPVSALSSCGAHKKRHPECRYGVPRLGPYQDERRACLGLGFALHVHGPRPAGLLRFDDKGAGSGRQLRAATRGRRRVHDQETIIRRVKDLNVRVDQPERERLSPRIAPMNRQEGPLVQLESLADEPGVARLLQQGDRPCRRRPGRCGWNRRRPRDRGCGARGRRGRGARESHWPGPARRAAEDQRRPTHRH